jgi:hypothetical protein
MGGSAAAGHPFACSVRCARVKIARIAGNKHGRQGRSSDDGQSRFPHVAGGRALRDARVFARTGRLRQKTSRGHAAGTGGGESRHRDAQCHTHLRRQGRRSPRLAGSRLAGTSERHLAGAAFRDGALVAEGSAPVLDRRTRIPSAGQQCPAPAWRQPKRIYRAPVRTSPATSLCWPTRRSAGRCTTMR